MLNEYKIVNFREWCRSCVHQKLKETEEPCNECLSNGVALFSHRPVKYEGNGSVINERARIQRNDK